MSDDVERIIAESEATVDRLRDLTPRDVPIHVPDAMERWKTEADEAERRRRRASRDLRRQERAEAARRQAAAQQQQIEHSESWEARFAIEREYVLAVVGEIVGMLRQEIARERKARKLEQKRREIIAEQFETLRKQVTVLREKLSE